MPRSMGGFWIFVFLFFEGCIDTAVEYLILGFKISEAISLRDCKNTHEFLTRYVYLSTDMDDYLAFGFNATSFCCKLYMFIGASHMLLDKN